VAVVAGAFPAAGDPDGALAATRGLGGGVVVEALQRPVRLDRPATRRLAIAYAEDDGVARRWAAAGWLLVRSPLRTLAFAGANGPRRLLALAGPARRIRESGAGKLVPVGDADAQPLAKLTGLGRG
jgi:hypothetical protein